MNKDRLKYLLQQHFDNTISSSDFLELRNYLDTVDPDEILSVIDEQSLMLNDGPEFNSAQSKNVLDRIKADSRFNQPVKRQPRIIKLNPKWLKVAAIITVFGTIAFYYAYRHDPASDQKKIAVCKSSEISPGSNKAILTQANGKTILLDSAANGILAKSGKTQVNKVNNGKLVYNTLSHNNTDDENALIYNTLTTPRGGEYQVVLPDGTHVWLNSSSSLSYPVEFAGNERRVKLTGEAYFEVAKNKDKPFYVNINDVQVRVLGTHFNITGYTDDHDLTTTLLEGAVRIDKADRQCLLKPGQQAVVNNNTNLITVSKANISQAMAWKNGYFVFDDEDIASIMKRVSRWYDADIELKGNFGNQHFGGAFSKYKSINELLGNLEKIGKVHFKIEGRRIIVME
jgi:hypothetical protein